jgi:hypothetical protein
VPLINYVRKVSSGFEYFLLIFALRLVMALKVVGLDTELNSATNGDIFEGDHRAKKGEGEILTFSSSTFFCPMTSLENITIRCRIKFCI